MKKTPKNLILSKEKFFNFFQIQKQIGSKEPWISPKN
jgi:hypothetical protein